MCSRWVAVINIFSARPFGFIDIIVAGLGCMFFGYAQTDILLTLLWSVEQFDSSIAFTCVAVGLNHPHAQHYYDVVNT